MLAILSRTGDSNTRRQCTGDEGKHRRIRAAGRTPRKYGCRRGSATAHRCRARPWRWSRLRYAARCRDRAGSRGLLLRTMVIDERPDQRRRTLEEGLRTALEVRILEPAPVDHDPVEVILEHLLHRPGDATIARRQSRDRSRWILLSRYMRISVESATTVSPSRMYGSLPLGALPKPRVLVSYGSPESFSSISAFITKGLASGSPKNGPKVYSVIIPVSPRVAPVSCVPRRRCGSTPAPCATRNASRPARSARHWPCHRPAAP